MAATKKTVTSETTEVNNIPITASQPSDKSAEYEAKIEALTKMVEQLMAEKSTTPASGVQIIDTTAKMDRPCTLIHLRNCANKLPDTIKVGSRTLMFSKFGEQKLIKFSEMQEIVSTHSELFNRGILALGNDCSEFAEDLNAECIVGMPFDVKTYNTMHSLSNADFEKFISGINEMQRVHIGATWMTRYNEGKPGYDNIEKLRILNKYTDGMFNDVLSEVVTR